MVRERAAKLGCLLHLLHQRRHSCSLSRSTEENYKSLTSHAARPERLLLDEDPDLPTSWGCPESFDDSSSTSNGSLEEEEAAFASDSQNRLVTVGKLGRGASASVFKAVDVDTLQMVAIKVILFISRDNDCAFRIRREVAALSSQCAPMLLNTFGAGITPCPYICNFYGVKFDKARMQASIAMEYACCGTLKDWSKDGLPVPEPWLAHVAYSVLQALNFTHTTMDRIHRDVKPCNILLSDAGAGTMSVKLADFGCAVDACSPGAVNAVFAHTTSSSSTTLMSGRHQHGGAAAERQRCRSDPGSGDAHRDACGSSTDDNLLSATGTQRYMAPERLAMAGYSFNSDVWSAGLTLATLANGGVCPLPLELNEFNQLEMALAAEAIICGCAVNQPADVFGVSTAAAAASVGHLLPPRKSSDAEQLGSAIAPTLSFGIDSTGPSPPRLFMELAQPPPQQHQSYPLPALALRALELPQLEKARRDNVRAAQESARCAASIVAARLNLSVLFAPSSAFSDFLRCCLVSESLQRRSALSLLEHPFLAQRAGWERMCPEVLSAATTRRRSTNLHSGAASTTVAAIAAARQDSRVGGREGLPLLTGAAPGMAALAHDLGVDGPKLVGCLSDAARNVYDERVLCPLQGMWVGPSPCW